MKTRLGWKSTFTLATASALLFGSAVSGFGVHKAWADTSSGTSSAGGTYFTDSDNWGGGPADSSADGDVDVFTKADRIGNGQGKDAYPFELKIKGVDKHPTKSAYLLVRAYDVDEYDPNNKSGTGEWDRVYISSDAENIALDGSSYTSWPSGWENNSGFNTWKQELKKEDYVGALSGVGDEWSTTVLTIKPQNFNKIAVGEGSAGDNYVGMTVHNYIEKSFSDSWVVTMDWAQLVVDGGIQSTGVINPLGEGTAVSVSDDKVTINTGFIPQTSGNFSMEANVIHKVNDNGEEREENLALDSKLFEGATKDTPVDWSNVELSDGSIDPDEEYIVNIILFDDRGNGEGEPDPGMAEHMLSISTFNMVADNFAKTGSEGAAIPFGASDFQNHFLKNSGQADATNIPNGDNLQVVRIDALPDADDGMLSLNGTPVVAQQEIPITELGGLSFAPAAGNDGVATFTWNGYGQGKYAASSGTVTMNTNRAPVLDNITKEINKGDPLAFTADDFGGGYSDTENDPLTQVKIVSLPDAAKGKLQLNGSDVVAGDLIHASDIGNLTFVPEEGATGPVAFDWNGSDGSQFALDNKTVTIQINTPPVVSDIQKTGLAGAVIGFSNDDSNSFAASYQDMDGDVLDHVTIMPPADFASQGTLSYESDSGTVELVPGESSVVPAAVLGTLKFTPVEGLPNGAAVSFNWTAFDGKQDAEAPAAVNIVYNGVPAADAIAKSMEEGSGSLSVTLGGSDLETTPDALTYTIVNPPAKGTLAPANPDNEMGAAWLYTPNGDFVGGTDSFTYTVTDGDGQISAPVTVTVTVNRSLDGWVGDKPQGDLAVVNAIPGQPLLLSAVSSLSADQVTADVNGTPVNLVWVNQETSLTDGYKLWKKTNYLLPGTTGANSYTVTFSASDASGGMLPAEPEAKMVDNGFQVLSVNLELSANPSQIVGDGKSTTTLTAVLTDANNQPIPGVDVVFAALGGSFVGPDHAITDANGIATVVYKSEQITGTDSQVTPVTATVQDTEKGLSATDQIQVTFLPARIQGVITTGDSNSPVPGATVRVTLDLNGDGKIEAGVDFDQTVTTDASGAYSLAVPKGDVKYDLEVTRSVDIGGTPTSVTYNQTASVGEVTGTGDESFESDKTAAGIVLLQKPDGKTGQLGAGLLGKSKVYLKDKDGNYVTEGGKPKAFPLDAQGIFNAAGLTVGDYTMEVRYEVEAGKELTIASGPVSVKADGELNITESLIDPYGTVTDAITGDEIEGASVTLYYADTNTKVSLPAIPGFVPNDNASPEQLTDENGFYAYMVYPNTDYYLIISKDGYQTVTSPTLEVGTDILKYDAALSPNFVVGPAPVQQDPKVTVTVSSDKNLVQEGEQSTVTVDYKNDGNFWINSGKVSVTLPDGVEVMDAAGGTVAGSTITWTTAALSAGQSGSVKVVVKWPQLTQAEKEFEIPGQFAVDGSSAATATAKTSVKINVFSDRFENLQHERYILGYPDGTFKRDHSLTRAELAAIVARLTENDTVEGTLPFKDVRSGHWATNYIKIAVNHGYFSGFADGTFRPDQQITRGELAAVMARFLGLTTGKPVSNHFTDTEGNWAENAIEALYLGHYLSGYTDGTFKPNQKIRRDEAVTMINRMLYRGPLQGLAPVFPDVPEDNWSFGDVQEATVSHESTRNSDGSEAFVRKLEDGVQ